jgi:hypothetical protein
MALGQHLHLLLRWLIYKIVLHTQTVKNSAQFYVIDHGDMPNVTMFLVRTHCLVVKQQQTTSILYL